MDEVTLETIEPFETLRLRARSTTIDDAVEHFAARRRVDTDSARMRFLGRPPAVDVAEIRDRFARLTAQFSADLAALSFTLRDHDERYVGVAGFTRWSRKDKRSEMFWELDPLFERRGYATEAASALLRFGLTRLGLHRVEAWAHVDHVRSRRVAERIGLKHEATLRDFWASGTGGFDTAAVYSLVVE
jgi:RimJ/RimL family protein N-acetyltransferase